MRARSSGARISPCRPNVQVRANAVSTSLASPNGRPSDLDPGMTGQCGVHVRKTDYQVRVGSVPGQFAVQDQTALQAVAVPAAEEMADLDDLGERADVAAGVVRPTRAAPRPAREGIERHGVPEDPERPVRPDESGHADRRSQARSSHGHQLRAAMRPQVRERRRPVAAAVRSPAGNAPDVRGLPTRDRNTGRRRHSGRDASSVSKQCACGKSS